jgi:hypothetical protein
VGLREHDDAGLSEFRQLAADVACFCFVCYGGLKAEERAGGNGYRDGAGEQAMELSIEFQLQAFPFGQCSALGAEGA